MRGLVLAGVVMQAVLLGGCVCLQPVAEFDAGAADSGTPDSGMSVDGGSRDAGVSDSGDVDAGAPDAADLDAGERDGGEEDASVPFEVTLEASTDQLDGVVLIWDAGPAAVRGFFIERDGMPLGSARFDERTYLDTQASLGWLDSPGNVTASENEKDGILVAWDASVADAGSEHRYVVVAETMPGVFVASNEARGWRAAPQAALYEVQRADGGLLARTPALSVFDEDAGGWALDASVDVTTEEDDFRTTVILSADASISLERFPESYRVRAMQNDGGAASAWSPVVTGRRTDELYVSWQWQRSAGPTSTAFADLPRVMGPRWFDPYPVLDETRFYRLALRVERLGEVVSPARSATLYRPLKLALGENQAEAAPALCIWLSDGRLICRDAAWPQAVRSYDAGTDIVELSGGPQLVCGLRSDAGVECWGTQPVVPGLPPVSHVRVGQGEYGVCGLDGSGTAICSGGWVRTPDGGWLDFDFAAYNLYSRTAGVRATDRAYEELMPSEPDVSQFVSIEHEGPYLQVSRRLWDSCAGIGLLIDGGTHSLPGTDCTYATLPPASGGYRLVASGVYVHCGLRADGFAVCRGGTRKGGRLSSNVPYLELQVRFERACGLTAEHHVECWDDGVTGTARAVLPPRMPVRDVIAGDGTRSNGRFKFVDESGRFLELMTGPVRGGVVTPDDRFASFARSDGEDVTLIREDGGVLQWIGASLPPGDYAKVDLNCGLEASGTIRCPGWAPAGAFLDVGGGDRPCGLRFDGGIECDGQVPQLPAPGPYKRIVTRARGGLCAQRSDDTVVCDVAPGFAGPVRQFDLAHDHACAVLADGGVQCVVVSQAISVAPLPPAPPGPFKKVSVGLLCACAIRLDGTGVCWGDQTTLQQLIPQP